jgi:hypothetical protein
MRYGKNVLVKMVKKTNETRGIGQPGINQYRGAQGTGSGRARWIRDKKNYEGGNKREKIKG